MIPKGAGIIGCGMVWLVVVSSRTLFVNLFENQNALCVTRDTKLCKEPYTNNDHQGRESVQDPTS